MDKTIKVESMRNIGIVFWSCKVGWDRIRWDGMRWDVIGWDGIGQDWMGLDQIISYWLVWTKGGEGIEV